MKKKSIGIIIALFLVVLVLVGGVALGKSRENKTENPQESVVEKQVDATQVPAEETVQETWDKDEQSLPTDVVQTETEAATEQPKQEEDASLTIEQAPGLGTPSDAPNPTAGTEEGKTSTIKQQQSQTPAVTKKPNGQATMKPATGKPTKTPTVMPTEQPVNEPVGTPVVTEAPEKEEQRKETVTLTIDASVIGNGTLLSSKAVEIKSGETVSHAVARALTSAGFTYSNTGSVDRNFYLSAIKKSNLIKNPTVSDHVMDILEENGVKLKLSKYSSGSLGEFDFTNFSGWRYSINGTFPGVGMSEYEVKDGDRIVLRYTLCLGYDA